MCAREMYVHVWLHLCVIRPQSTHLRALCMSTNVGACVCVCARVHVALHTCPLAMASLNISLTSNIICTVGLNWPTHTDKRPAHTHKQHQEKPR